MSLGEGESNLPVASWRVLARKNVLAGLLFIAVGALGLWLSRDYPIGTALRMGTGYVPRLLCWLLLGLGVIILVQGLRQAQDARPLSRRRERAVGRGAQAFVGLGEADARQRRERDFSLHGRGLGHRNIKHRHRQL